MGVEVFFVISGFVIPYSLWQSRYRVQDFARYMVRRIVRLEPPYLASIVLVLVLWELSSRTPGFAGLPPDYGPSQLLLHLFYLIPLSSERWLNPVYWSLAYEFVFYVSMGLLFPLLFNRHVAWTAVAALSICAATGSALALLFLLGIVAMRFKSGVDTAWEAVTTAMVATVVSPFFMSPVVAAVSAATAAFIALCPFARLGAPLAALGAISYSLFLTHVPIGGRVVNLGMRFGDGTLYQFALSTVALMVSIVFAWLFYRLIERPALRASRTTSAYFGVSGTAEGVCCPGKS